MVIQRTGLDAQQGTCHAGRSGPPDVCLTFLTFCKHLEDGELSMLLFHIHHHTQYRAHEAQN